MRAVLLLFPALLFANGFMRTSQHRREENYLGSGRQRDTPTIKANMISTALHMFSPDVNESAPGALSLFGIEKVEYHLTSDRSSSKEAYDIDCNSTDPAIDSTVVSCKEKIRCARNFSELDLELVPSTYSKNNLNVLNWFCNKGEHCCELECCTYKSKTGLIFGLFVIGTVMLIGVIICLVRALESVRENRRMEQYVKQVQAVYRANDGGPRTMENLSFIEQLPRDMIWMIMEYAPESVFDLRMTSKMLQFRTAEFVCLREPIPIVSVFGFYEIAIPRRNRTPLSDVRISMEVPANKANLFELRLKLGSPLHFLMRITRIIKYNKDRVYNYISNTLYGNDTVVEYLRECSGRKIEMSIIDCKDSKLFLVACRLLQSFQFAKMKAEMSTFTNDAVNPLIDTITEHGAVHLSLIVKHSYLSDPDCLLLQLSSILQSIEIIQLNPGNNTAYFFGDDTIEWDAVILEMFSGKLDRLKIDNRWHSEFLPKAYCLRTSLPESLTKKVWLYTTCKSSPNLCEYLRNGHIIRVIRGKKGNILTVKHTSRQFET